MVRGKRPNMSKVIQANIPQVVRKRVNMTLELRGDRLFVNVTSDVGFDDKDAMLSWASKATDMWRESLPKTDTVEIKLGFWQRIFGR
jgi:hypothetical protein